MQKSFYYFINSQLIKESYLKISLNQFLNFPYLQIIFKSLINIINPKETTLVNNSFLFEKQIFEELFFCNNIRVFFFIQTKILIHFYTNTIENNMKNYKILWRKYFHNCEDSNCNFNYYEFDFDDCCYDYLYEDSNYNC